ncbi:hypothetical protein M885DRAFT_613880 [Pelagophyceae sp. CCMP2097]|nr:hypothetical protein M885DRAFT_613880 [Pelagophyceae sp. CCMP2097]|mmetsp:Transcript_31829/g.107198  ORF Transcript_31829/g.107198 Transcript_31829/m.107198 type:complete len:113 (-) Transcript_31829:35-373(-)
MLAWWNEKVIKPIHNYRLHLPPIYGVHPMTYMQFVYPVGVLFGGYWVMQWAISYAPKDADVAAAAESAKAERKEVAKGDAWFKHDNGDIEKQKAALQAILEDARQRREGGKK